MFLIVFHSVLVHLLSLSLAFLKKKKHEKRFMKKTNRKHTVNIENESTNKRKKEWVL